MELEVGEVVLCTVEKIEKTVVFVKIEGIGKPIEGSITMSEIAPGRIRNIRDYVVPKKKIVCVILRISGNHIELSLRRVTQKEKKEVLENNQQERSYISILKSILGEEKAIEIESKILQKERIYDFFEEVKSNPKKLEEVLGKEDSNKILEILNAQKKKIVSIKKEFSMKSFKPNGITLIKKILEPIKNVEIKYISAGRYSIKAESEDLKKTSQTLKEILEKIGEEAKKCGIEFDVKER
ncbi:MAG TPA: hypothetical protein VJ438_01045 [Candidatus Nanoarchaeia archaeon]|nr:hypothetical protein [Candidatus Nanoarchaeia archaeon]